jgi:spoIIIJ-associated protein
MMTLEETGRTPEDAVAAALEKLGLPREYVLVETLEEGTKGFLGFGGQRARVRVTVTPAGERLVRGREVLEALLGRMGLPARVQAEERQGVLHLGVLGEHAGLLIGRHGRTLEALQFVVARILDRQLGERAAVVVDVEGYRQRHEERLRERALRLARQVRLTGEAAAFEPMAAGDRRIIHVALQGDAEVGTESVGDGPERHVVIKPARSPRLF